MKKAGSLQSKIYNLKGTDDKFPRLSYCDMESIQGYDNEMEMLIGYINYSPSPEFIMFTAYNDIGAILLAPTYITFQKMLLNIGESFESETGTFTAPTNGIYEFTFSGLDNENLEYTYIDFEKNGTKVLTMADYDELTGAGVHQAGNNVWSLQVSLHKSDKIRLKLRRGGLTIKSDGNMIFTGKYIQPI